MGSTSEQYCLRWNDFHANVTGAFSDIRDDEDFLDVTLVSDGQAVKAHKLVLSSCSPLFRTMLKKNSHPQPMIFLHGVRYADIVAILNFMYHGEVNVNQEDLPTFLAAAEELRIRGLSDKSPDAANAKSQQQASSTKKGKLGIEESSNRSAAAADKDSSMRQQQADSRRLANDYPDENSQPFAKKARQSQSDCAVMDGSGSADRSVDAEEEEDDYGDTGQRGHGNDEGYYNNLDMYAAARGMMNNMGSPGQGKHMTASYNQR